MSIKYDNTVYLVSIIIYWGNITFYNYVRNTVCPIVVGVCWLSPVRLIYHSRCGLYDIPTDLPNPACQWRPFVVTGKNNLTPGVSWLACHILPGPLLLTELGYKMTSSNGNIFRLTGPLWGEFTRHRWIPHTKASDAELWCFLWSAPELSKQWQGLWFETPSRPLWRHCNETSIESKVDMC